MAELTTVLQKIDEEAGFAWLTFNRPEKKNAMWNHPGNTHPPIGSQTVFPDYVSGTLCAIIIISGVLHRDRHKKGAFIDLAQSEATAFMRYLVAAVFWLIFTFAHAAPKPNIIIILSDDMWLIES